MWLIELRIFQTLAYLEMFSNFDDLCKYTFTEENNGRI